MAGAGRPAAGAAAVPPSPRELMPPPPPRPPASALLLRAPPPPRVLEEDEFTLYLEEIIERDFFPELPRLKNRLDWLEATRSGDPERIRAAQLRIQERLLARTPGGAAVGTPSVGTPLSGSSAQSTPARGYAVQDEGHRSAAGLAEALAAAAAASGSPADLSLDTFLARYTSEDNASFNALMAKVNAQREARLPIAAARAAEAEAAAHNAEMRAAADRAAASTPPPLLLGAGEAGDEGAGSSVQVFAGVASGRHVAKNSLFYVPDGKGLTVAEAEAAIKASTRSVNIGATRFGGMHAHVGEAPPAGELHAAAARTPGLRGYSMLATPSPAPGVGESPIMTWGRLDATPLRLDPFAADDPPLDVAAAGGRTFHIAPPRKRDEVAHALAHGKGGSLRGQGGSTPRRAPGAAAGGGLSEAAQRMLARSRGGSERSTDWDLRRSYATPNATPARGTPAASRGATPRATPRVTPAPSPAVTPLRGAKRPRGDAPASAPAGGAAAQPPAPGARITDGLLQL